MVDMQDEEVRRRLAANVNLLLAERGWSGAELARAAGEEVETIKRVRRASNHTRFGVVVRIARAFGTSIDSLVEERKPEKVGA